MLKRSTKEINELAPISNEKNACWHWYHGAIFYLLMQGLTFGLAGLVSGVRGTKRKRARDLLGDQEYFRSLKQAKFTPPSWAFGPAWTINNVCVIWGMLRVFNMPAEREGRAEYLGLQAASWLNFVTFSAAYFGLRSPLNALIITLSMFVLTIMSGFVALFRLRDTWVALSLATLFLWLLLALSVATCQALWNIDEFYQLGPFVQAPKRWVKSREKGKRK
jgi:translocator protein